MRLLHALFTATALTGLSVAAHADGFSYTLTTATPGQGFSFTSATLLTGGNTNILNTTGISNLTCSYAGSACTALSVNPGSGAAYYGNSTKVYANGFSFNVGTQTASSNTLTILALPAPEPSSLILLGTGILGTAGAIRRRYFKA